MYRRTPASTQTFPYTSEIPTSLRIELSMDILRKR